jgi:hypothetical protein
MPLQGKKVVKKSTKKSTKSTKGKKMHGGAEQYLNSLNISGLLTSVNTVNANGSRAFTVHGRLTNNDPFIIIDMSCNGQRFIPENNIGINFVHINILLQIQNFYLLLQNIENTGFELNGLVQIPDLIIHTNNAGELTNTQITGDLFQRVANFECLFFDNPVEARNSFNQLLGENIGIHNHLPLLPPVHHNLPPLPPNLPPVPHNLPPHNNHIPIPPFENELRNAQRGRNNETPYLPMHNYNNYNAKLITNTRTRRVHPLIPMPEILEQNLQAFSILVNSHIVPSVIVDGQEEPINHFACTICGDRFNNHSNNKKAIHMNTIEPEPEKYCSHLLCKECLYGMAVSACTPNDVLPPTYRVSCPYCNLLLYNFN